VQELLQIHIGRSEALCMAGSELRRARDEAGLSKRDLAEASGMAVERVAAFEKTPSFELSRADMSGLLYALNATPDDLNWL